MKTQPDNQLLRIFNETKNAGRIKKQVKPNVKLNKMCFEITKY
jgi:hypothetical protein